MAEGFWGSLCRIRHAFFVVGSVRHVTVVESKREFGGHLETMVWVSVRELFHCLPARDLLWSRRGAPPSLRVMCGYPLLAASCEWCKRFILYVSSIPKGDGEKLMAAFLFRMVLTERFFRYPIRESGLRGCGCGGWKLLLSAAWVGRGKRHLRMVQAGWQGAWPCTGCPVHNKRSVVLWTCWIDRHCIDTAGAANGRFVSA